MSSHREAPGLLNDPAADNTDLYAFVSPNDADKVTIIANYLPLQEPAGGPNFFLFGDDVLYEIHIDNDGDAEENITFQFRFKTQVQNPSTFLYNTGPITSLNDENWNIRQRYSVTKVTRAAGGATQSQVIGEGLISPPCNIGPRSTPDYPSLSAGAIHSLGGGVRVFAGQREDPFFVDLGSVFDLAGLRPFNAAHVIPLGTATGIDTLKGYNVHSIAIEVPKTMLTRDGSNPATVESAVSVIGVYASASRQKAMVLERPHGNAFGRGVATGPWVQVSRLGNPLINEVIIELGRKDLWNHTEPSADEQFLARYRHPELMQLLPVLYPGVFPNLAARNAAIAGGSATPRDDLVAILLTGLPTGVVTGFQNFTGPRPADLLRLNMAVPPAATPSPLGILGGDLAGFPNGRRLQDDVVAIELRAVAGVTYPLISPSPAFTPDAAASALTDGTSNDVAMLGTFPFVGEPHQGYSHNHHAA